MSRPKKVRKICCMPNYDKFGPIDCDRDDEIVGLKLDEYETLRLIDYEGLTQTECAARMHIARTTVQGIYKRARFKVSDALVNGKKIRIEGGRYKICKREGNPCGKTCLKNKIEEEG